MLFVFLFSNGDHCSDCYEFPLPENIKNMWISNDHIVYHDKSSILHVITPGGQDITTKVQNVHRCVMNGKWLLVLDYDNNLDLFRVEENTIVPHRKIVVDNKQRFIGSEYFVEAK